MADPITREQVERLIACLRDHPNKRADHVMAGMLGMDHMVHTPDYVREAVQPNWHPTCDMLASLTRWRDELAAAAPVRRVARWDADLDAYALTPIHDDGALMTHAVEDAATARDWGYKIEGGPEPIQAPKFDAASARALVMACNKPEPIQPAEASPERLRERRDALGLSRRQAAALMKSWTPGDVHECETCGNMHPVSREHYAAALSAEEARRATVAATLAWLGGAGGPSPAGHTALPGYVAWETAPDTGEANRVWAAQLRASIGQSEPERPAPRFKVGDPKPLPSDPAYQGYGMEDYRSDLEQWHCETGTPIVNLLVCGGCGNDYADTDADPQHPKRCPRCRAPEVVDVPQLETWHACLVRLATEAQTAGKACAEAEAAFTMADAERERTRLARAAARDACHAARTALTVATTARAIIDAQQGGAS
jgi:hypothetical protein